jgi:hypothetical protein
MFDIRAEERQQKWNAGRSGPEMRRARQMGQSAEAGDDSGKREMLQQRAGLS